MNEGASAMTAAFDRDALATDQTFMDALVTDQER